MKIGHYQLECAPGDVPANVDKVLNGLAEAHRESIEIISFPESFLTGYFSAESEARKCSFPIEGEEITTLLKRTAEFSPTWMVGFNELRDGQIFNTVFVATRGKLLGAYRKAFPEPYFTPGRSFPVFERNGLKFGVVICADGGFIEPARILALQGARVIFAPHYNYIAPPDLINHFQTVRSDHIARAVENKVWFFRGNNVVSGYDKAIGIEGVGYGESYLLDPRGEFVVRGVRHRECLIYTDIDVTHFPPEQQDRSRASAEALGAILNETLKPAGPACR